MNAIPVSRRVTLTSVLAVTAVPLALAVHAVHPDSELIRLCARHDALERQHLGLYDTITDEAERDVQLNLIDAVQNDLLSRILELKANTFEGLMTRVRTACLSDAQVAPDTMATLATSAYSNERQMAALVRDLMFHAGVAA